MSNTDRRRLLVQGVEAVEHDVARLGPQPGPAQHRRQPRPLPLADRRPALDAVVLGDLGPRGAGAQVRQAERQGPFHQPVDDQPVGREGRAQGERQDTQQHRFVGPELRHRGQYMPKMELRHYRYESKGRGRNH